MFQRGFGPHKSINYVEIRLSYFTFIEQIKTCSDRNRDEYPDTWISKLFWLSIIRILEKLKYPSIQVSKYP